MDPANGWNPTDIQVRSYSSGNEFKKSIGYRKSAEHDMEETKNTGFHNSFGSYVYKETENGKRASDEIYSPVDNDPESILRDV